MKLVHSGPCSKCGEPGVRKEYELSGKDKFGYNFKVTEICKECGRNWESVTK